MTLEFRCYQPLGVDDLRTLQGLLAIGSPIGTPEILTGNPEHRDLRDALNLSDTAQHLDVLVVRGSYYTLAKEIGLSTEGSATYRRIRESVERLCGVTIYAIYKDGTRHSYRLIGGYASDEKRRELHVVLNPRLTAAVLGKRINATGGHTRIEMAEARQITGEATYCLHQYLCAIVGPGETREFTAPTLRAQIWLQSPIPPKSKPAEYSTWMARINKQNQRLKKAMAAMNAIGWQCSQTAISRSNSAQTQYQKWSVSRPAILEVQDAPIPEFTTTTEDAGFPEDIDTIAKRSPARALTEFADRLTPEQFAECAAKQPTAALKNCLDRLNNGQFSAAIKKSPEAAIRYALDRLTDDQFAAATQKSPKSALTFGLARLSPAQFVAIATASKYWPIGNPNVTEGQLDAWFDSATMTAVDHLETIVGEKLRSIPELIPHVTSRRLLACARAWPISALQNSDKILKISADLLSDIANCHPADAIKHAAKILAANEPDILGTCVLKAPAAAIRYWFQHLDSDQRQWCLKKSPWTAFGLQSKNLTTDEQYACRTAIKAAIPSKMQTILTEGPEFAIQYIQLTTQQRMQCEELIRTMNAQVQEISQNRP